MLIRVGFPASDANKLGIQRTESAHTGYLQRSKTATSSSYKVCKVVTVSYTEYRGAAKVVALGITKDCPFLFGGFALWTLEW